MGAVEFVADKDNKRLFDPVGSFGPLVKTRAEERYHLICRSLPASDACAFSPPLIITEEEIDEMFDRFAKALDDCTKEYARRVGAVT
jgi:4-aminobutyrate---pyruvate transaminase